MREHWIFVEFIQKHALTNIYFMHKVRKGKKRIEKTKGNAKVNEVSYSLLVAN